MTVAGPKRSPWRVLVTPLVHFCLNSILLPMGMFPGVFLRRLFLPCFLGKAGRRLWVYPNAFIHSPELLRLGDCVNMNYSVYLDASGGLEIGNYSGLGPFAVIMTSMHRHPSGAYWRMSGDERAPVKIGNDCLIGAHAVLLPGTELGDGCIVAPGSLLRGRFPSNAIIVGNPGRVTQYRKPQEADAESGVAT